MRVLRSSLSPMEGIFTTLPTTGRAVTRSVVSPPPLKHRHRDVDTAFASAYSEGRLSDMELVNPGTGWANTEYRSYKFDNEGDGITETAESRQRRGLQGPPLPRQVQRKMFETTMQKWEDQGMQDPVKTAWKDGEIDAGSQNGEVAAGNVKVHRRRSNEVEVVA